MYQYLPIDIRRKLRQLRWHRYRLLHYVLPQVLPELLACVMLFGFVMLLPILAAALM